VTEIKSEFEVRTMSKKSNCEECIYYNYDEESDSYDCSVNLDEDDRERFLKSAADACPFYRRGGDYESARRQ